MDVLVTAGGTQGTNRPRAVYRQSLSGKMGWAIAVAAASRGADVTLVTAAAVPGHPGVEVVAVETADEMAGRRYGPSRFGRRPGHGCGGGGLRPERRETSKLRRADGTPDIGLEPTPDILGGVAAMPGRPFLVGFAAETGSLEDAVAKAKRKEVDLLVANDVSKDGSGFGSETNEVTLVLRDGSTEPWELAAKSAVADRLWVRIAELRPEGGTSR